MQDYFKRLYLYNHWANLEVLAEFKKHSHLPAKALMLFSHIVTAQKIWYSRISGRQVDTIGLFDSYSITELENAVYESSNDWLELINTDLDYNSIVKYTNTKGVLFENMLQDIVAHVANHATYHRAQINTVLRESGLTPVVVDYIAFARQK